MESFGKVGAPSPLEPRANNRKSGHWAPKPTTQTKIFCFLCSPWKLLWSLFFCPGFVLLWFSCLLLRPPSIVVGNIVLSVFERPFFVLFFACNINYHFFAGCLVIRYSLELMLTEKLARFVDWSRHVERKIEIGAFFLRVISGFQNQI